MSKSLAHVAVVAIATEKRLWGDIAFQHSARTGDCENMRIVLRAYGLPCTLADAVLMVEVARAQIVEDGGDLSEPTLGV